MADKVADGEDGAQAWKHPNDMSEGELRNLVREMGWMALDLAQHLSYSRDIVDAEHNAEAFKKATEMAYELAYFPWDGPSLPRTNPPGLAVFGATGLEF